MYVVEQKVASGGMAAVYRGYDPSLDRPVAIKVLRPELATAQGAERFLREARHLAHVSHPNVVAIHEVGEAAGLYFYVMDLVAAPTLAELLERGPLPAAESVRVAIDLLKALEAVHATGIIHRDVKPGNVFVADDRVLLGDFGIAKTVDAKGGEPLTSEGQVIGTPGFMAPEQDIGREVTPRSDLYAVGLVLFQCLTGRSFGEADTLPEDATWSRVPSRLRKPIKRALAWDPAERWPDAAAFRKVLESVPPVDEGPEARATPGVITGRRPVPLIVLLVTVAVLAGLGLALLNRNGGSGGDTTGVPHARSLEDRPSLVVLPCNNLSPDTTLAYHARQIAVELTHALGGVPDLAVVGQMTAATFRGTRLGARAIGDALDVDFLVSCQTLRGTDSLRISAQLEDTATGRQLWGGVYVATDVNEVAGRLTKAIVSALGIRAFGPFVRGQSPDLEALDLYLRGRNAWSERTEASLDLAESYLRQALEIDPDYAVAYGGLADVYGDLAALGFMAPDSAFPVARRYAERAIALAPDRAEPHAALAEALRTYFWEEWAEAGEHYRRAIDLNPSYPVAHTKYSLYLSAAGRLGEAITVARRAVDIDPRSPHMATGLAVAYFYNRDFAAVLTQTSRALELDPSFGEARLWKIGSLIRLNRTEEALALLDEVSSAPRLPPLYQAVLAYLSAAAGESGRAQEFIEALESGDSGYVSPFWTAVTLGELGRLDDAFEELSRAYDVRDEFMVHLGVSPVVDSLREDPRFSAWVDRLTELIGRGSETTR